MIPKEEKHGGESGRASLGSILTCKERKGEEGRKRKNKRDEGKTKRHLQGT